MQRLTFPFPFVHHQSHDWPNGLPLPRTFLWQSTLTWEAAVTLGLDPISGHMLMKGIHKGSAGNNVPAFVTSGITMDPQLVMSAFLLVDLNSNAGERKGYRDKSVEQAVTFLSSRIII